MTDRPFVNGPMALDAAMPPLKQRLWEFPIVRILGFFGLSAAFLLVLGFGVQGMLHAARAHTRMDSELTTMLGYFCLAVAVVLAYVIMVRRVDRRSLASAGLAPHGVFSETGIGLLIGGGTFSAVIGMMRTAGAYHIGSINPRFHPLLPLALFLFLAIFQEVAVRGYVFQTLERRWGSGIALVASSLFFGLAHLGSPASGATVLQWLVGPLFIAFETSLLFTAGYLLTRRLWLPIGLHWGWNFFESSIYGTANSGAWGNAANTLFADRITGSFFLTGGPFGPEASVVCLLIGTYAGVLLLRLAIRKGQWQPANSFPSGKIDT